MSEHKQLPQKVIKDLKEQFPDLDTENAAFMRALYFLEKSSRSLFITGKAGTGKSTLIKLFREITKKSVLVLAPSGIAAINAGGQTIHSFFGFPLRPILLGDKEIKRFRPDSNQRQIIQDVDTIIIDEISMVRADLLDAIHYSLAINSGVRKAAFGGKQLVVIGDPFQLPPVVKDDDKEVLSYMYKGPYFFNAHAFNRRYVEMIELEKIYRQRDMEFVELLNRIRSRNLKWGHIYRLNERYEPNFEPNIDDYVVTLCTTNKTADSINKRRLNQLKTPVFTYDGIVEGDFPSAMLPTEHSLELKVGAQVIFIRNDPSGRWVNGTLAKITELEEKSISVMLENGQEHEVEAFEWENKKYKWDLDKGKIEQDVIGTFNQFPLKLAWAITIHKSQGLTFDRVIIDLGRGAFAHGQLYVALSRCRSFEGVILKKKVNPTDVIVDKRVSEAAQKGYLNDGELKLF